MIEYIHTLGAYTPSQRDFEGKRHLVIPVVMLTIGVHNGSSGPMLYSDEELSKFHMSWNGVPVPIFHPTTVDGKPLSCNIPAIIEQQTVGRIWNTVYENGKLKGEAWIDIEKTRKLDPSVLRRLMSGDIMEVSTGMWSEDDAIQGEWNGEKYIGVVRNIRPDHLALLPNQIGACSVRDGCGVRVNSGKGGNDDMSEVKEGLLALAATSDKNDILKIADALQCTTLLEQKLGMAIQGKLDEYDVYDKSGSPIVLNYVVSVGEDHFIYLEENYGVNFNTFLYKKQYNKTEDGAVVLGDKAEAVIEERKYLAVNAADKEEVNTMADEKKACCPEKVQALITANKFDESDRESLELLSAETLEKVELLANAEPVIINEEQSTIEEDAGDSGPVTIEQLLANAEPEVRAAYEQAQKDAKDKKDALVSTIMANKTNMFTTEELIAKSTGELTKINALLAPAPVVVDYSGQGGADDKSKPIINSKAGEPLKAPTLTFSK